MTRLKRPSRSLDAAREALGDLQEDSVVSSAPAPAI